MLDLASFKSKQRATSLSTIAESFEQKGASYTDARYWKPVTPDKKDGASSSSIIRFLPSHNPERPFITAFSYSFAGVGGQYIENSLESIGQPDPVKEYNYQLWTSGNEDKKADTKKRGRKMHYVGNILVVKDLGHPENDGKVFLYKFGAKIMEKITAVMKGDTVIDKAPVDIFDFDHGANFHCKMTYNAKIGFYTYDASDFVRETAIGSEDEQLAIIQQIYDLETCEPVKYKSYEELQKRFKFVMSQPQETNDESADGVVADIFKPTAILPTNPVTKVAVTVPTPKVESDSDEFSDFDSLVNSQY